MNRIQLAQLTYEKEGYWGDYEEIADWKHILYHLNKSMGDLATYLEMHDHDERGELPAEKVPKMLELYQELKKKLPADLVIFGTHLAIKNHQDLEQIVTDRVEQNKKKKSMMKKMSFK